MPCSPSLSHRPFVLSQWNDTPKSKSGAAPSANKTLTKTPRARAAAARAAARRGSSKVLEEQHSQAAFFGGSDDDDDDADANAAAYDVDHGGGGGDGDGLLAAVKNMNRNLDAALSPMARRRQQCETLESESPEKPARAAATNATKATATKRPPVVRRVSHGVSRQPSKQSIHSYSGAGRPVGQSPGRRGPGRQGPGRGSMMTTLAMDMAERRLRIEGEDGGNGDGDFSDESSDSGGWFEET